MMDIYIYDQLVACLAFLVLGILSGFVYDVLRTFRYILTDGSGNGGRVTAFIIDLVLDLVFMLSLAVATVVLTYCYSYGKLRFFCTASFVTAFALYRVTLGRLYSRTVQVLILKFRQLVLWFVSLALLPIGNLFKLIRSFIFWVSAASVGRLVVKCKRARADRRFLKQLNALEADITFEI